MTSKSNFNNSLPIFLVLLMIGIVNCTYNKTWSQILNKISAVTHCDKDQIINWNCKICKEG